MKEERIFDIFIIISFLAMNALFFQGVLLDTGNTMLEKTGLFVGCVLTNVMIGMSFILIKLDLKQK